MELFDYIEVFYNQRRRHSTLGQISPAAFERRADVQDLHLNEARYQQQVLSRATDLRSAQRGQLADARALESGTVGIGRMHHQLEGPAARESNGGEVTHVAGREPADVERLREGNDGGIDEAQVEVREAPVHFHRARELTSRRRRVGEGTGCEIPHERLHRRTLVPQKVVNFR
jgi:hypothetical protein